MVYSDWMNKHFNNYKDVCMHYIWPWKVDCIKIKNSICLKVQRIEAT